MKQPNIEKHAELEWHKQLEVERIRRATIANIVKHLKSRGISVNILKGKQLCSF